MFAMNLRQQFPHYLALIRFDRPVGTYLLLWPCLWALWFAAEGVPPLDTLVIFVLGTFLMRSAGCVINDYADRNFDGHVKRTENRPMATGKVSEKEALGLFVVICMAAFIAVCFTNQLTILLAFGAVLLASLYPFMKRHTHFPQVVLGAAFAWAVPMSFAAVQKTVPHDAWLLYIGVVVWTVVYDTFYAMVDRDDDLKVGIKSTAVLFGNHDRLITALLQVVVIMILVAVGYRFAMSYSYYLGLLLASLLFVYQQQLIKNRERDPCFTAFINNHRVGMVIFIGIAIDYALRGINV